MKNDLRRLERLEVRHRASVTHGTPALTDDEIDSGFRAMLVRLRTAMAGTGGVPFVDAVLDLEGLTFGRCAYFLFLLLLAVDNGDAAAIDRAAHRLEGCLRAEAPLAWAAYAEGWHESVGLRPEEKVIG